MNKIKSLYKVFMLDSLDSKFVFIYNLLFPIGFFLISCSKYFFSSKNFTNETLLHSLSFFWSYIIIVTLLNMVIFPTLTQREYGYYKEFYFITGSKWIIFFANFLVQITILLFEIFLFDGIASIVFRTFNLGIIIGGVLSACLLAIPVTLASSIFLVFKIKIASISIIETVSLLLLFSITNFNSHNWVLNTILLINPVKYLSQSSYFLSMMVLGKLPNFSTILQFSVVTFLYILIGIMSFSKFSIVPIENRS